MSISLCSLFCDCITLYGWKALVIDAGRYVEGTVTTSIFTQCSNWLVQAGPEFDPGYQFWEKGTTQYNVEIIFGSKRGSVARGGRYNGRNPSLGRL